MLSSLCSFPFFPGFFSPLFSFFCFLLKKDLLKIPARFFVCLFSSRTFRLSKNVYGCQSHSVVFLRHFFFSAEFLSLHIPPSSRTPLPNLFWCFKCPSKGRLGCCCCCFGSVLPCFLCLVASTTNFFLFVCFHERPYMPIMCLPKPPFVATLSSSFGMVNSK